MIRKANAADRTSENKEETIKLYEKGLTLLKDAIEKKTFGEKQLKAMAGKANSIMRRITELDPSDEKAVLE